MREREKKSEREKKETWDENYDYTSKKWMKIKMLGKFLSR